ncbi:hypothetical protein NL676_004265 [Syzygium grande]|nr:hypothetical protein NL676_004265 [Syzygium grande]
MATARNHICRPSYRFLDADLAASASRDSSSFELDESDLYSSPRPDSPDSRGDRPAPNARIRKKPPATRRPSLPVNVPDWSKILRGEYRENRRRDSLENGFFDDDDDEDDDAKDNGEEEDEGRGGNGGGRRDRRWVPPHELVARTATATASASSVTLKGRDLSRVRNAIWAKTGFQD